MNRASLLQETAAWMDTVDLALCLFIYEVCNDYQFEYLSGSDFVNFLNLKPTGRAVIVRPKENLRICYMVFSIARTIKPRERGKLWSEEFLKRCGISKSYYDKHRSDVATKVLQKRTKISANPSTRPLKTQDAERHPITARRFPIQPGISPL